VMVEGGGRTLGAFHDAGLADEAVVFVAPRFIGGRQAPSPLNAKGPATLGEVAPPVWVGRSRCGQDDVYHIGLTDPSNW